MESKHTAAPWINEGFAKGGHYISDNKGNELAIVNKPIHDSEKLTKSQAEANANLIASAPELLAALKACYTCLTEWDYDIQVATDLAKSAIAKAEGVAADNT